MIFRELPIRPPVLAAIWTVSAIMMWCAPRIQLHVRIAFSVVAFVWWITVVGELVNIYLSKRREG